MESKVEFLKTLPIFQNLEDDELAALAKIAPEYTFEAGGVIAYQRDIANSLYIVRSGRLFASTLDDRGIVRETRPYDGGQYFGESWLFKSAQHTATVRATEPGRLIIIDGLDLSKLLKKKRGMIDGLEPDEEDGNQIGLSDEAWAELTEQIEGVEVEKEHIVYKSWRTRWILFGNTIVRLVVLGLFIIIYFVLSARIPTLLNPLIMAIIFVFPMFILILTIGLSFIDWYYDYFIITQRQMLHYEFDLRTFGRQVQRTPLEQIQSVNAVRPNLLYNILRIGTLRVTTGAAGGVGIVEFDKLPRPVQVQEVLEEQRILAREEAQQVDLSRTQAAIRQAVEGQFQIQTPYQIAAEEGEEEAAESTPGRATTRIGARLATRVETSEQVIYRKSLVFLVIQLKWGALLLAGAFISGAFLFQMWTNTLGFNTFCATSWLLYFAFSLLLFYYEFADWYNDQYVLTERYVIDIDKLPFGLRSSQSQADLVNIQNVTTDQAGILPNIFNYGNVIIETAGATADIEFERVTRPKKVQEEILTRQNRQRQRRARRAEEQRLREMAIMLDVYKQTEEQQQLPQRTMAPAEVERETQRLNN